MTADTLSTRVPTHPVRTERDTEMLSRLMTIREQMIVGGLAVAIIAGTAAMLYLRESAPPAVVPVADAAEPAAATASASVAVLPVPAAVPAAAAQAALPQDPPSEALPPPLHVTVAIEGAVRRPGVYELPSASRIHDLLHKAGGAVEAADLSDLNLTAMLEDATTLTVPYRAVIQRGENAISVRRPGPVHNPPQYTRSGAHLASRPGGVSPATAAVPANEPAAAPVSDGRINLNTATQQELETLPGIGAAFAKRIIDHRTQRPFTRIEDLMQVPGIAEKRFEAVRALVKIE